jgi:hypothetical protein
MRRGQSSVFSVIFDILGFLMKFHQKTANLMKKHQISIEAIKIVPNQL